ncbi:MAG: ABC transporter ATP-binding protein [Planctomycetaceae bacterium]|nr:ABC transporter ATP-binding protein [Planctomycetaceae bacterium]
MSPWVRLTQLGWPHRRRLAVSVVFGALAASLWGLELLLTFPVATVFLEGKSLATYLQEQTERVDAQLADHQRDLDRLEPRWKAIEGRADAAAVTERAQLLTEQAKCQRRMNSESWQLWFIGWIETRVLPWLPQNQFRLLAVLLAGLVVTTFFKGLFTFLQDQGAGAVAELCVIDLRALVFRKVLNRDPQSIELEGAPKILSGLTYDLSGLTHGLTTIGGRIVREPLKAVACIIAGFCVNWRLTALALIVVPVAGWLFSVMGRRLKRAVHRVFDAMARIYQFLEECFHNVKVVIAYQQQGRLRRQFHRQNRDFYKQSMRFVKIDALTNPATEFLGMAAVLLGVLPGGYLVLRNTTMIGGVQLSSMPMSVSELITLYAILAGVLDPLRKFSKYFPLIKQCGSALERVFRLHDQAGLVVQSERPLPLPRLESTIELRDVHFHYAHRDASASPRTPVLKGVSLTVTAGETIALVGPNGSGKSTLIGLLTRFYDPSEGAVLFDDADLRDVRLRDLRDQLALVPQEPLLFDDTIAANIRYGRPSATAAEIHSAAVQAHVWDFAESLPQQLATSVGPQGKSLSGGQRQRVALARALLRDPRVLILDEPMAAVDAVSEQLLHRTLKTFVRGRTTFLITHQLSAAVLEYVTRIVLLDHGRVIATGRHEELLAISPLYQRLFAATGKQAA